MRVPTFNTAQRAFDGVAARQAEQARLQTQLGTSLRVNTPGDDPVAAAQAEMARSRLAHVAQDQRAQQLATSVLSAADGALAQGVELLQSVRERLVAAGNGAYSAADRASLALELRGARERLLALANTQDGAGGFVFAGQGAADGPMTGNTSPAYDAAAGVQRIGQGGQFAATVDGRASFMSLPQGNGVFTTASAAGNTGTGWIAPGSVANPSQLTGHDYRITLGGTAGALTYSVDDLTSGSTLVSNAAFTAGSAITIDGQRVTVDGTPAAGDSFGIQPAGQQSVFQTLDDAIATLEMPAATGTTGANGAYAERLQRAQVGLDRALDGMLLMRSRVGDEMRGVEDADAASQQQKLVASARRSDLEDLDYADALSRMQTAQIASEAALKSYAAIGKTSLFQYLS